MCGTENLLVPASFLILEAAHLCITKEVLLKGRSFGFSDVPKIGNFYKAININRKERIDNQFPEKWSDRVVF